MIHSTHSAYRSWMTYSQLRPTPKHFWSCHHIPFHHFCKSNKSYGQLRLATPTTPILSFLSLHVRDRSLIQDLNMRSMGRGGGLGRIHLNFKAVILLFYQHQHSENNCTCDQSLSKWQLSPAPSAASGDSAENNPSIFHLQPLRIPFCGSLIKTLREAPGRMTDK